jgi:hypothetical protein
LRPNIVSKYVKYARGCGNALDAQLAVDPGAELLLGEELLEGGSGGKHPICILTAADGPTFVIQACSNDQEILCQSPGRPKSRSAFPRILDDIDYIAKVDNVRRAPFGIRSVLRIPAIRSVAKCGEPLQIAAATATIVEETGLRRQKAIIKGKSYRP